MNHWHALIFGMEYPWGKEIQVSENKVWYSKNLQTILKVKTGERYRPLVERVML